MGALFERVVDVRWRDTDALGHVNHAVFLTYLEEGRDAFFVQTLGGEPDYVVARIEIDQRAEVRHPQRRVTVRLAVERLGTTSLAARETILTAARGGRRRGARRQRPVGPPGPQARPVQRGQRGPAGRRRSNVRGPRFWRTTRAAVIR